MAKKTHRKIRADFRKKHDQRKRTGDLTRRFQQDPVAQDESVRSERVSGKGELSRKRTVIGTQSAEGQTGLEVQLEVDESQCLKGRVLSVHGLESVVQVRDGRRYRCTVRGLLKTLSTDQRHVVVTGDQVLISVAGRKEGVIERVEPRRSGISRTSRGRQHVIATNVDQLVIVSSVAEPALKPNLIDRFLVTAEKAGVQPLICINKIDLGDPADLQPLVGLYGQMGYAVLLLSAKTGFGVSYFKRRVAGKDSVVLGQSGVGKSSLLNAIDPSLRLRVREVSAENQKGKHATSTARLIPLKIGGHIVDTPGIRQFPLWDVIAEEVEGFYRDLRPYVSRCRFPNCTHMHEADCAVKDAVADGRIDVRRYESYCQLAAGDGPAQVQ